MECAADMMQGKSNGRCLAVAHCTAAACARMGAELRWRPADTPDMEPLSYCESVFNSESLTRSGLPPLPSSGSLAASDSYLNPAAAQRRQPQALTRSHDHHRPQAALRMMQCTSAAAATRAALLLTNVDRYAVHHHRRRRLSVAPALMRATLLAAAGVQQRRRHQLGVAVVGDQLRHLTIVIRVLLDLLALQSIRRHAAPSPGSLRQTCAQRDWKRSGRLPPRSGLGQTCLGSAAQHLRRA